MNLEEEANKFIFSLFLTLKKKLNDVAFHSFAPKRIYVLLHTHTVESSSRHDSLNL